MAVVNGPAANATSAERLTQIIELGVDADGVARFCLGRFWRNASPEQQKRYIELFHQVLVEQVTSKLGDYQGVRFTMPTQQRDDNDVVSTVVEWPNNPPTNVDWIVSSASGAPHVVAEGTSLRCVKRSDVPSATTSMIFGLPLALLMIQSTLVGGLFGRSTTVDTTSLSSRCCARPMVKRTP